MCRIAKLSFKFYHHLLLDAPELLPATLLVFGGSVLFAGSTDLAALLRALMWSARQAIACIGKLHSGRSFASNVWFGMKGLLCRWLLNSWPWSFDL